MERFTTNLSLGREKLYFITRSFFILKQLNMDNKLVSTLLGVNWCNFSDFYFRGKMVHEKSYIFNSEARENNLHLQLGPLLF